MCKDCKQFITETKIVTTNIQVDSNANSVIFYNTGTSNVFIDGIKVTPGTSFAITGNRDEICIKVYDILFTAPGTNQLTVVYKRYVK
jgi:hypothetical protein